MDNPSSENSPSDRIGFKTKWPLQENLSPESVVPENEYGFLFPGSVWNSVSVTSIGPINRRNGVFGVISLYRALAPLICRRATRSTTGFAGFGGSTEGCEYFPRRSEKFSVRSLLI